MKVLVTGANGQLGRELQAIIPDDIDARYYDVSDLDITRQDLVIENINQIKPDLVINAAAYTAVDKAESDIDSAYKVNRDGAVNLAKAVERIRARYVYVSTDFVFDGAKSSPYATDDVAKPLNVYGKSKFEGEQGVTCVLGDKSTILRTSWVYSSFGNNFVKTVLNLLTERDELSIVADQIGSPTWAAGLANAVWRLALLNNVCGIFHWTDSGVASWYDFAVAIQEEGIEAGILDKKIKIKPIRTSDYPTPARRPSYSVLDKTELSSMLGYVPDHWRVSLRQMIKEYSENK